jgi:glutaredoxin
MLQGKFKIYCPFCKRDTQTDEVKESPESKTVTLPKSTNSLLSPYMNPETGRLKQPHQPNKIFKENIHFEIISKKTRGTGRGIFGVKRRNGQLKALFKSGNLRKARKIINAEFTPAEKLMENGKRKMVEEFNMSSEVFGGMSELTWYVFKHTERTEQEGIDVQFFHIAKIGEPKATELKDIIQRHVGDFCEADLFDNREHGYIEIGKWCGSQEVALKLMGLGTSLGLFTLMTPNSMIPNLSDDLKQEMAEKGFITITAKK